MDDSSLGEDDRKRRTGKRRTKRHYRKIPDRIFQGIWSEEILVLRFQRAVAARTDLCVVDPGGEFLGREAAEDERVNGAEPGARQHRDDRLGYHRHVDEHAVALHHAATLKHRRQLRYLRARTYTYNNDNNEGGFLFQRLSMLIQRFNPVLLHDCFVDEVVGHSS